MVACILVARTKICPFHVKWKTDYCVVCLHETYLLIVRFTGLLIPSIVTGAMHMTRLTVGRFASLTFNLPTTNLNVGAVADATCNAAAPSAEPSAKPPAEHSAEPGSQHSAELPAEPAGTMSFEDTADTALPKTAATSQEKEDGLAGHSEQETEAAVGQAGQQAQDQVQQAVGLFCSKLASCDLNCTQHAKPDTPLVSGIRVFSALQHPSQMLSCELQATAARAKKAAKRKKKKQKRQSTMDQASKEAIERSEALQKPNQSSGGAVAMCLRHLGC